MKEEGKSIRQLHEEMIRLRMQMAQVKAELDRWQIARGNGEDEPLTSELEAVFTALPDIYFRLSKNGVILDFLVGNSSDLYVTEKHFLGKPFQEVMPSNVTMELEEALHRAMDSRQAVCVEYDLDMPKGQQRFEARFLRYSSEEVVCVVRNITEWRRAEAISKGCEESLSSLLEAINDLVWELNSDLKVTSISPNVCTILGYYPGDMVGKNFLFWMAPGASQRVRTQIEPLVVAQLPFKKVECACLHKDGRQVDLEISGVPILDQHGHVAGYQGIARDITDRKRAEFLRDESFSLFSHDLRNPLTVIRSQAWWLERTLEKAGMLQEAHGARKILNNGVQMCAMLDALLESARLESNTVAVQWQAVDLATFVPDILERAVGQDEHHRLQVEMATNGRKKCLAWADRSMVERALTNLLTNALKYSPTEKSVTLTLLAAEGTGKTWVQVKDSGPGIAPKDVPHLFSRFFRIPGSSHTGLGLGLYSTRLMVEAMGGRIQVETELGKGSTFSFWLQEEEG